MGGLAIPSQLFGSLRHWPWLHCPLMRLHRCVTASRYRIRSRASGDDRLSLSLNESADQAALYFRESVENQQVFD
jgi:hypothetical protein